MAVVIVKSRNISGLTSATIYITGTRPETLAPKQGNCETVTTVQDPVIHGTEGRKGRGTTVARQSGKLSYKVASVTVTDFATEVTVSFGS